MTCPQCKHQYCWLCLDDWSKHGAGSGSGFYNCNSFNKKMKNDVGFSEEVKKQNKEKEELERFNFYFERY